MPIPEFQLGLTKLKLDERIETFNFLFVTKMVTKMAKTVINIDVAGIIYTSYSQEFRQSTDLGPDLSSPHFLHIWLCLVVLY